MLLIFLLHLQINFKLNNYNMENVLKFTVVCKNEDVLDLKEDSLLTLRIFKNKIVIENEKSIGIGFVPESFASLIYDTIKDDTAVATVNNVQQSGESSTVVIAFDFDKHDVEKKIVKKDIKQDIANINTDNNKNKDKNDKRNATLIIAIVIIALVLFIATCLNDMNDNSTNTATDSDSIDLPTDTNTTEGLTINNVNKSINKDSIIDVMRSDFNFRKDEYNNADCMWVEPKSAPKYRSSNRLYAYFALNNGQAENLRIVLQYTAEDWLFIKNCQFNIDGWACEYIPSDMQTDNGIVGGESKIWEWCDDQLTAADYQTFLSIGNAKKVKMKLNGQQYYDSRNLTNSEIRSIRKTLEYYRKLGGKVI